MNLFNFVPPEEKERDKELYEKLREKENQFYSGEEIEDEIQKKN